MTLHLILDENVIEFAAKLQNHNDELNPTCGNLISEISKRCDIIYCTKQLFERYSHKLKILEQKFHEAAYIAKLLTHMAIQGKIKFEPDAPRLPNEEGIPPDDAYLVRLAVKKSCILVSTDCRLREKLESSGLIKKHDIQIKHPEEV